MPSKVTRRELAAALAASSTLLGQQPQAPQASGQELPAARALNERMADQLAKVELNIFTEPAFTFKA